MDLNLDWMTLDDFQKHLNGEDEMISGPPLSPSESVSLFFEIILCKYTFNSLLYVFFPTMISLYRVSFR